MMRRLLAVFLWSSIVSASASAAGQVGAKPRLAYDNFFPMISPDMSRIVFSSNRNGNWDLFLMDADGSNVRPLVVDDARDSQPAWSRDGARVVFESRRTGDGDIYRIDADGSNLVRITSSPQREQRPFYSPDGRQIVFHATVAGVRQVFIANADGTEPRQLTGADSSSDWASWTNPNGPILFESFRTGHWEVYSVRPDGTELTQLTDYDEMTGAPMLSSDGARIITHQNVGGGNPKIVLLDRRGRWLADVTDGDASDTLPSWSPDNKTIVFCSDRSGSVEIYSMGVDGTGLRQLSTQPEGNVNIVATALADGPDAAARRYREVKPFYPNADLYPMGRLDSVGVALSRQGNLAEAIKIFQLNVEAFPESVYTHGSLADAYRRLGNETAAAEHYRRMLEIDPDHAEAKQRLGGQ